MTTSLLLKVGILVEVIERNGRVSIGWLDEVGITQYAATILIADRPPAAGDTFKGRKIRIQDIEELKVSGAHSASF